jgi:L-aminopeptidase/D-esterase-like protein
VSPNRSLTAVAGLQVGHAQDVAARTGCTVVLGPFTAVVEVRGLATGSRELDALSPLHVVPCCDALLLTGGSAFGLAAADGVVAWLEERGRGFRTAAARVPIVPAAVLYDLAVGDASVRPDPAMGRAAAEAAGPEPVEEGPVGAGCGATVGKLAGSEFAEPSGVGSAVAEGREGTMAALAAVNAFGDVVDADGTIVAGCRAPGGGYRDTARTLRDGSASGGFGEGRGRENTTLGVVATDVPLGRTDLQVVARQAVHGLIRRLRPAATPFDGDMVFALSTGAVGERLAPRPLHELLPLALRAEEALAQAVTRAVRRR